MARTNLRKSVYCVKCNQTKKHNLKTGISCLKCKTLLKYKCGKCTKIYSSPKSLKNHLKTCGKSDDPKRLMKRYFCDNCKYKSVYKTSLLQHIQAKHSPRDPNSNKCNGCGKCYSSNLLRHLKLCEQTEIKGKLIKRYACDHCNHKTYFKYDLANHIQAKHLPRNLSLHTCQKCDKSFSHRSTY